MLFSFYLEGLDMAFCLEKLSASYFESLYGGALCRYIDVVSDGHMSIIFEIPQRARLLGRVRGCIKYVSRFYVE